LLANSWGQQPLTPAKENGAPAEGEGEFFDRLVNPQSAVPTSSS
jgi:hypothetical protein